MIRKLIISAAILTALIVSKESHAAGVGGLARDLAVNSVLALQVHGGHSLPGADNGLDGDAGMDPVQDVDRMTTGQVAGGDMDGDLDLAQDPDAMTPAADVRLPFAITLFHPF